MLDSIYDAVIANAVSPVIPAGIQSMMIGGMAGWCAVAMTSRKVTIRRLEYAFGVAFMFLTAVLLGVLESYSLLFVADKIWLLANIFQALGLFAVSWGLTTLAVARANDSGHNDGMLYLVGLFPYLAFAYLMKPSLNKAASGGFRKGAWKCYGLLSLLLLPLIVVGALKDEVKKIVDNEPEILASANHRISEALLAVYGAEFYADHMVSQSLQGGGKVANLGDRIKITMPENVGPEHFSDEAFPGIAQGTCNHQIWGPYLKSDGALPIEFHGSGLASGKSLRVVAELCE